jgi:hypothetical protein
MAMRNRRMALVLAIVGLGMLASKHPTADLRFITHDVSDPSPRRMQAAVDLGVVGVSVLYTWTVRQLR